MQRNSVEGASRVDWKRRSFLRAQSADRRRREKGHRGAGPQGRRDGVHAAGLRGLLGLGRTPHPLRLPGAGESAAGWGGRWWATPAIGCGAEGLTTLGWVREPEGILWGPEGPHLRGEEEP